MNYTANVSPIDEDGIVTVTITGPAGYEETHSQRYDTANQWVEQELAILNHPDRDEECEHGLSAALCSGPYHY